MPITLTAFLTAFVQVFLSTAPDNSTLSGLLDSATEVVTWIITTMGSYVTFIIGHPIVMVGFIVTIAGVGLGFFFRIFRSM